MLIFIDTSSLVKRYIEETGSPEVDQLFSEQNDIVIASITSLEIRSALNRKLRENTISKDTYDKALGFWKDDIEVFDFVPFDSIVIDKAAELIESHGTRTLDAIQMGSALVSNPDRIVTSDRQMHQILNSVVADKVQII